MIADPLSTRIRNWRGSEVFVETDKTFDLISNGPGSKTERKNSSQPIAGMTVTCRISHEVTTKGRLRSTLRFDAAVPVGASGLPDTPGLVPHSASAYLVVDQANNGSESDLVVSDSTISALLHALVTSRGAGATLVPSAILTDFLNGEP